MADALDGWVPLAMLRRAANAAAAVPLTATFVALGLGVLVGRSLADLAEHAWWRPSPRRRSSAPGDAIPQSVYSTPQEKGTT